MSDWDDWVGRTTSRVEPLDPAQARQMQATLDREPSLTSGDPLPPAWHWLYFHEAVRASDLGQDGHPRLGLTMPPVPLPRRMWAGGTLDFDAPLVLGESAEQISTITAVEPKQGRTGPLFFVTLENHVQQGGQTCVRERQTIVYRERPARAAAVEPPPGEVDFSREWHFDATALFRYSALTFNGHRIHYDADYCRQVEGYPDLVVHGPLLATLLLDLVVSAERPLRRFEYRAHSPVVLPRPFTVNGRREGEATDLWVSSHDGRLTMRAQAE